MMRLLAIVFCATLFAGVLAHEASALRGGGIRAGAVGVRGVSVGAYRGGLRARNLGGYRAAAWGGRRYWRGGRWYGYGAGLGYPANRYRSAYSGAYGYYSGMGNVRCFRGNCDGSSGGSRYVWNLSLLEGRQM